MQTASRRAGLLSGEENQSDLHLPERLNLGQIGLRTLTAHVAHQSSHLPTCVCYPLGILLLRDDPEGLDLAHALMPASSTQERHDSRAPAASSEPSIESPPPGYIPLRRGGHLIYLNVFP